KAKYQRENGASSSNMEEDERFFYSKALENFRNDPKTSIETLLANARDFFDAVPDLFWRGYSWVDEPPWLPRRPVLLIALVGLAFALASRREPGELSFWLLLLASVISSSALVYTGDGKRVMAVSYPLLWLLLSSGFAAPWIRSALRTNP